MLARKCYGCSYSTANFLTTGDGYWLGYEAGADFINMEFPEFSIACPRGEPLQQEGSNLSLEEGEVFNRLGERFMEI